MTPPRSPRRRKSRSTSRTRRSRHRRSGSQSKERRWKSRSRSQDRAERDRDRERRQKGLPSVKGQTLSGTNNTHTLTNRFYSLLHSLDSLITDPFGHLDWDLYSECYILETELHFTNKSSLEITCF